MRYRLFAVTICTEGNINVRRGAADATRCPQLIEQGYAPGPSFGKMLAAVEDAQLEARVQNREEALALVRAEFGAPVRAPAE